MGIITARAFAATFEGAGTDLDGAWDLVCTDDLSKPGGFSLNLQNDDADLDLCDFGAVVQFSDDGVPVFAGIVTERVVHSVAPDEEHGQFTEITGPGTMGLNDSWVVYPERPLAETLTNSRRLFNVSSFYFDDSGWDPAVEIEQGLGDPGGPREGFPLGLPTEALSAWWISSEALDGNGSVPAGDQYYRSPTIDVVGGRLVRHFITADNSHEFYIDNELIHVDSVSVAGGVGWAGVKTVDRYLANGQHLYAVKVTNVAGADPNPSGFIFAAIEVTNSGSALSPTPLLVSDDSWKALGYPAAPPGFTLGAVLRILTENAAVRGVIVPALGFTDDDDSDGNPWPTTPDITVGIGDGGLAVLAQLAEAYVDLSMRPDTFTLDAWPKGAMGAPSDAVYTAATNIASLTHTLTG